MSRVSKLVLFYGAVLLLLCDAHALWSRLELTAPPPLSWPRVTTSLFTQAVVLLLAWAYLRLITSKPRLELRPFGPFDSWRVRYTPIAGLAIIASFAVAMLYSGLTCSDKPFPSRVRGEQCR